MRISDWSSDVCSSDLLDRHDKRRPPVRLLKIDENGAEHVVKSVAAADWGDFLRYRYLRFDFSDVRDPGIYRSEEHASELQSLMRISYAVFCLTKKKT